LIAGIPTDAQARALVRHLLDERRFWGPRPLAATTWDDPATADDVYWRGRIWPPLVFLTWEGLRRYGFEAEAAELATRAWRMFAGEWAERRHCHENYRIDPAAEAEVPDSDSFYSWGALLPLMTLLEDADASPWTGLTLRPGPAGASVTSGGATYALAPRGDGIVVERDGRPVLELGAPVAVRRLEVGARIAFAVDAPAGGLDVLVADDVALVERDGEPVDVARGERGAAFRLAVGPAEVVVYLRP
jgi:putative isomerase